MQNGWNEIDKERGKGMWNGWNGTYEVRGKGKIQKGRQENEMDGME